MKKILLFIAAAMFAMSASAQGVFLRGNGDWGTPSEMEFTKVSEGVYELVKEVTLTSAFKIADASWGDINYGSNESAKIGTIAVTKGGGDIKVTSTINATKITLDIDAGTLTIVGADGGAIEISSWTLCGVGELVGDAWDPTSTANVMTESNGVYTITKEGVSLSASFVTDAGTATETPGYGYKVAANAQWGISEFPGQGNQFLTVDADGIYDVTFTWNPASQELTAVATPATTTDLEDVDAEDAVVAAYDITGKPVAADAAGIVILQYASGKAVKVFNN
ncbi:MAG: hypothetical protein UIC45_03225 [Paludibacteraceae bacterium]|nr:hypothetical protein [Paludibacteraceae bacterium]